VRRRIAIHYFRGAQAFVYFADDGAPAGFVVALIDPGLEGVRCFGRAVEMLDVIVREPCRGKGYGRALLEHVEEVARAAGSYCVYVSTYAGDGKAVSFYVHCGYVPVATLPDVHGPGDEGQVYLRKIVPDAQQA
jgi:GNAT superfamily N-acetyltransferase